MTTGRRYDGDAARHRNETRLTRTWQATAPEPTAWQTSATDTFAGLQNPGAVGIANYLSGSVTNAPVVVRMSALNARPAA